jgi:hypothetical protein
MGFFRAPTCRRSISDPSFVPDDAKATQTYFAEDVTNDLRNDPKAI